MTFRILDVPRVKQLENHCGPAALSMVLKYYSHDISQEDIAEYWGGKKHFEKGGVKYTELAVCAEMLGLKAQPGIDMNLEDIIFYIDKGIPIIARTMSSTPAFRHFCVIKGYQTNPGMVFVNNPPRYVNDPRNLYGECMLYERFDEIWTINRKGEPKNYGIVIEQNPRTCPEELVKKFKK